MTYSCPHCDGTGREPLRSLVTFGGQCQTCRGTGELRDKPRSLTERQVLWYLTEAQFTEHTAANDRTRHEVQADLDRQYRIAS